MKARSASLPSTPPREAAFGLNIADRISPTHSETFLIVREAKGMKHVCPKCRKEAFSSSVDDLCDDVHWRCEACSYAAEEDKSMSAPCGRCGETSSVFGDTESTFRHCFHCRQTKRLYGPSLMDRLGWYYRDGKQKHGPFTRIEIRSKIKDGEILPTDLVYDPWGEAVEASEVVRLSG